MHETHDHLSAVGVASDEYPGDVVVPVHVFHQFDEETDIVDIHVPGLFIQADAGIVEMLLNPVGVDHHASPVRQFIEGEVGELPGDGSGLLRSMEEHQEDTGGLFRLNDGEGAFVALVFQRSPDHDTSMHGSMLGGETCHHHPGG